MNEVVVNFKTNEDNIELFLVSPLLRCQQTAEIFKVHYPKAIYKSCENLSPDHAAQALYDEIQAYDLNSLAIIGHEPDLGQFISWVLFRQATDHFPMKKAGIAKLDLYKDGRSYLKWLIRPKLLT